MKTFYILSFIFFAHYVHSGTIQSRGKNKTEIDESKSERIKTTPGSYGYRENERKRIEKKFNFKVTGDTHEAEHVIGVKVLTQDSDDKIERKSIEGKKIEKAAPSYFEQKQFHRDHVGTGNGKAADEFRKEVGELMNNKQVGKAIILNQKKYAEMPGFKESLKTLAGKVASDSFFYMIKSNPSFQKSSGEKTETFKLTKNEQIDSIAERLDIIGKAKFGDGKFNIRKEKDFKTKIANYLDIKDDLDFEKFFFS